MNLAARSTLPEVMDDPGLDEAEYRRCLADLAAVNRLTFTHRATLRWLARMTATFARGTTFSVLDVAYGQGDLLRAIGRWANKRGLIAQLSGIDLNPRSRAAAMAATPAELRIDYYSGDVFDFTPEAAPDFIVTSQFTHHLRDDEVIRLLRWMDFSARRSWHIADLHRHRLAYAGFPVLARLMRWHPIVRADGAVSIARSFRRKEWERYVTTSGVDAEIRWAMPFRYCVSKKEALF